MEHNEQPPTQAEKQGIAALRRKVPTGLLKWGGLIVLLAGIIGGEYYWYTGNQTVYSDNAQIFAPVINLSSTQPSFLSKIFVHSGEAVDANQPVAQMEDGSLIRTQVSGVIVGAPDAAGAFFAPGTPVATMIDPKSLRLIVHIQENKGLSAVQPGERVLFTADAFGSQKFYGTVESIAPDADQSAVVFSISNSRPEQYFSVRVQYDGYPQLLDGMSARAWIYK